MNTIPLTKEQIKEADDTMKAFKKMIHEALDERDALDHETHKAHHIAVQRWIERQERHDAMMQKARDSAIGAVVVGLIGALAWVGKIVIEHVMQNGAQS